MFNFFRKKEAEKPELFFHTDIHCHIVPGIDDGQRTAEGGADLVAHEKEWGITRIFATPHVTQDTFENTPEIISEAFGKLKSEVESRGIDIELHHSAEYRMDGFFHAQLGKGLIMPFPNNYLLVENSFIQEAWNIDNLLFDLKLKGYKPILAHPERYLYYFPKKDRYHQLHDAGTLFQVNLLSLAGNYGKPIKQMAEYLLEHDMIDFIGTDMHNLKHATVIEEYLHSKDYRKHAEKLKDRIFNDLAF
jgi:tyrosine-protein phosphatase YwqE